MSETKIEERLSNGTKIGRTRTNSVSSRAFGHLQ
jgi:hypothetical protein